MSDQGLEPADGCGSLACSVPDSRRRVKRAFFAVHAGFSIVSLRGRRLSPRSRPRRGVRSCAQALRNAQFSDTVLRYTRLWGFCPCRSSRWKSSSSRSSTRLLERHVSTAVEWFPHEYVPWGRARDFVSREEWWDPADIEPTRPARSALFVNLLTEDNLPYYFRTLSGFGRDGVWGEWTRRWTAEEGRHAIVIRDYLMVTRGDRPGRARAGPHAAGVDRRRRRSSTTSPTRSATRRSRSSRPGIAHRNTGQLPRGSRGQGDHGAGLERREPALPLLPGPRDRGDRARPVRDGDRDGRVGARVHDARHRHPRLREARAAHRRGRHLRLQRSSSRRCCSR